MPWVVGTFASNSFPVKSPILRPHCYSKHEMQSVVTELLWSVCLSPTETDELIEVLFGLWTWMGPSNQVIGSGSVPAMGMDTFGGHTLAYPDTAKMIPLSLFSTLTFFARGQQRCGC